MSTSCGAATNCSKTDKEHALCVVCSGLERMALRPPCCSTPERRHCSPGIGQPTPEEPIYAQARRNKPATSRLHWVQAPSSGQLGGRPGAAVNRQPCDLNETKSFGKRPSCPASLTASPPCTCHDWVCEWVHPSLARSIDGQVHVCLRCRKPCIRKVPPQVPSLHRSPEPLFTAPLAWGFWFQLIAAALPHPCCR